MKQKYAVYKQSNIFDSWGYKTVTKQLLGYTSAYSAKQAICQMTHRLKITSGSLYKYGKGDGGVVSKLVAEEV